MHLCKVAQFSFGRLEAVSRGWIFACHKLENKLTIERRIRVESHKNLQSENHKMKRKHQTLWPAKVHKTTKNPSNRYEEDNWPGIALHQQSNYQYQQWSSVKINESRSRYIRQKTKKNLWNNKQMLKQTVLKLTTWIILITNYSTTYSEKFRAPYWLTMTKQ